MAAGSRGRLGCHPPSFSYYRRDLRSVRPPQLAASFISSFRNVLADGYEISEYPKFWTQRPRNIGGPSVGGLQLNFHFNRPARAPPKNITRIEGYGISIDKMSASRPTAHFSWDAVVAYETL